MRSRTLRPRRGATAALAVLGLVAATVWLGGAVPAQASTACPWVGSTAPVATRVSQLLAQMTIPDEISMVSGTAGNYVGNVAPQPALCIPGLSLEDGPSGVGDGMTGVTQLPAAVSDAASWDSALQQQYGQVVGSEQAGKGANVDLGPTINIVRDPRWGRAFESYGEDPYLNGQVGANDIEGVQSQGVLAQVKHYAVYNQETNRNTPADNAIVDPRVEQEIYLPAFQSAVNAGVSSVMCSYSTINGAPACDNAYLQNTVLKGQMGFKGFVTSDWGATKDGVQSATDRQDMQMPDNSTFGQPLQTAVQNGTIPKSTLDGMVSRILTEMFTFGLFDKAPSGSPSATVTTPAHAATAEQVANEGTVLLKNADNVLPLSTAGGNSYAIIGDQASSDAQTNGNGSGGVYAPYVVSPVQGISALLSPTNATKITASSFSSQQNTGLETTGDTGGGQDVDYISGTSVLEYANVNFGTGGGTTEVQARIASALTGASGSVNFSLDSATATPFASVPVTGTGGWQSWTTSPPVAASPQPTGTHNVFVTFTDTAGQDFVNLNWFSFGTGSGATATYAQGATENGQLAAIPAAQLKPASGSGQGLYGQYYDNINLSGSPVVSQVDQNYTDNFNGAAPVAGVNATGWSAKWTGTITPTTTGTYYFSTTSDDGSRLFVNGQELVNDWVDQGATTSDGQINLTAGQPVSIEVDYFQDGGGSTMQTGWLPPGPNSPITQAAALAAKSSVAVVFVGYSEGEGADLTGIDLPGLQNELIEAVAAANPHTVVVLNTGSAVTMPWINQVAGVMEAWYSGQEDGDSIASLLFGNTDPSGKLPVTFPVSLANVPADTAAQWPGVNGTVQYSEGLDVGYRWYQAKNIAPLFPFGYGLSYTSFAFSNLSLSAISGAAGATVTATATVTNTGSKAGSEVPQLYVGDPSAAGEPPLQLKGHTRVTLTPGQSQQVGFSLPASAFQVWSDASSSFVTTPGAYSINVGDSSANLPLTATYTVTGGAPANGFSVALSSVTGSVAAGSAAAASVTTATTSGSAQSVALTATGAPAGVSVSFSPASVTSGAASTVTFSTTAATAAGTYPITITGTAASGTQSATYSLTVTSGSGPVSGGLTVTASAYSGSNSVGTETTGDTGGGQDVGWINSASWLQYNNVNFSSGYPTIDARIASAVAGTNIGSIQFRLDSLTATPFATIPVSGTGGWQTWQTTAAAAESPVPTGNHTLYVTFSTTTGGNFVNVHWFQLNSGGTSQPGQGPVKVTASTYAGSNSVGTEATGDTGGGNDVGWINSASWLEYANVGFGTGLTGGVTARIASAVAGTNIGSIQFRLDSLTATPFATVPVSGTGGWQTWATTASVAGSPIPTGTHNVYVTFTTTTGGNFVNLNWFQFS
ncbi:MAG TPA: carbohydrate-binding protein [Actinocrinis sp.]|nr:carbohydrate-binding protein [Actinocrinis sp.]